VLERYFTRHAAINSFTQLSLRTTQRGLVKRWAPRIGGDAEGRAERDGERDDRGGSRA